MRALLIAISVAMLSAGCAAPSESKVVSNLELLPGTSTTVSATPAPPTTLSAQRLECERDNLSAASFEPPASTAVAPGTHMADLVKAGRIRVGVDENTLGFSSRDAATGTIEGFEVELAHEIAKRMFGASYHRGVVVTVPLVTAEKTSFVADGKVDLTISAVSMSCRRWDQVAFSAEYFTAQQEFLVRSDSPIRDAADLAGATVCVTEGSSSAGIIQTELPDVELRQVGARTDCLVALQYGEVDAYFGHDSFQLGMIDQDPTVEMRRGILPPDVTVSHYGIAVHKDHEEFAAYINAVLAEVVADGTWQSLSETWLTPLGIEPVAPMPNYARGRTS
jgi:polar amino acid transport system substrate-binding protein